EGVVAERDDVGAGLDELLEVPARDPEAPRGVLAVHDDEVELLAALPDERGRRDHPGCGEHVADEQETHAATIAGAAGALVRARFALVMRFDAVDRRIIEILREDGRASHASLAKAVGLSAPAVGERVRKLEQ